MGCVSVSGDKLAAAIRRGMTATLLSLLSHAEDSTRSTAAGCLGCMLRWLPHEELGPVVTETLLQDDTSLDWVVRHGRSTAIFVTLKVRTIVLAP